MTDVQRANLLTAFGHQIGLTPTEPVHLVLPRDGGALLYVPPGDSIRDFIKRWDASRAERGLTPYG